jgi:hypothetical protein
MSLALKHRASNKGTNKGPSSISAGSHGNGADKENVHSAGSNFVVQPVSPSIDIFWLLISCHVCI